MKVIKKILFLLHEYMYDIYLYARYNQKSPFTDKKKSHFYTEIIQIHKIEKGLSLYMPKTLFGKDVVSEQVSKINDADHSLVKNMRIGALLCYKKMFYEHMSLDQKQKFDLICEQNVSGGVSSCNYADKDWCQEVHQYVTSRRSVRHYKNNIIDMETINKVIQVSNNAPSQCNRQSVRVSLIQNEQILRQLIELQGCVGGFGHEIKNLFIVYSEISAWSGPQQRNQMYVDGGIYTMKLLDALWLFNLGGCCLNLAVTHSTERKIKEVAKIPVDTRLVAMVAFGIPGDDSLKSAISPRLESKELLKCLH